MNTILKPVKDWPQYDEVITGLGKKQNILITGCIESQKANMMESLCDDNRIIAKNRLILTYSQQRVREIAEDLKLTYKQMKGSESTEMSVELGEIYREMMKRIFKTLDKKGIRME